MKIQEEKKMMEVVTKTYLSDDGKEFTSQSECEKYELKIERNKLYKQVNHLLVLENYPPCDGGENYESHYYKWYKVNNENELKLVNDVFGNNFQCDSFPDYVCVEQYDEDDFCDTYGNTLSNCKSYVVELFGKLGFNVQITEKTMTVSM